MTTTSEVRPLNPSSAPLDIGKYELDKCGKIALVGGIASVALGAVLAVAGVTLCIVATPLTLGIGIAVLLVALPLIWFGYNCLMATWNIKGKFEEGNLDDWNLSERQFKALVEKNTILFGCVVNMVVDKMKSEKASMAKQ